MNPERFFLPNFSSQFNPLMRVNYLPNASKIGIFGKITNAIKRFNWNGFLNGANKTLNVVNQTIPLVRQAGPMVNNMKNMFKLAKAFGNETTNNRSNNVNNQQKNNYTNIIDSQSEEKAENNYPNFFI